MCVCVCVCVGGGGGVQFTSRSDGRRTFFLDVNLANDTKEIRLNIFGCHLNNGIGHKLVQHYIALSLHMKLYTCKGLTMWKNVLTTNTENVTFGL